MLKVGITGQKGFIGMHLYNWLRLQPQEFSIVEFDKAYFAEEAQMDAFVSECDTIVHLASMNRHPDPEFIYNTNITLTQKLIASLQRTGVKPHVLFSSSIQEEADNLYGRSKKECRTLLQAWAETSGGKFTGLLIPNVFGPFGKPFYNSAVATFCHQLTHGEAPVINADNEVKLVYVDELAESMIELIKKQETAPLHKIAHTYSITVSGLIELLKNFRDNYLSKGTIPSIGNDFERNLFNTFRSFIDIDTTFPIKLTQHTDDRGLFTEVIRLGMGGQVSFSTTRPGITRGNHFHTRKIERFTVIKGEAKIELRKIGSAAVSSFYLDGKEAAYVDMPVWYTHNITNIGEEELYTIFWINEQYNSNDPDTYFENV
jgi:UDP-2-acetamido-2,6-beta-L-arabino-hexul-4-ose reductase